MKKFWLFIVITLVVVILGFTLFTLWYEGFKEDRQETTEMVSKVSENYEIFQIKINNFSNLRNEFYTNKEELYYETLATSADVWNNFMASYMQAILDVESASSYLKENCDFEYGDIGARTKCTNFKANYEAAQNYYLTDVEVYNKLVDDYDKWNAVNGGGNPVVNKLEKVTIDDYIDFDGDGEYFGKEVA